MAWDRRLLPLVAVGLAGVVAALVLFPGGDAPREEPAAASAPPLGQPAADRDQEPAATRLPGLRAPPTPRSSNDLRRQEPEPELPEPSDEELARWQAEEPVALHALRDADRWREVAAQLSDEGLPELEPQAQSVAMRLDRARSPRPADELTALMIEEIELVRTIDRAGVSEDLEVLLRSIEQGAHHAIQGAPPPEVLEAQRREQQGTSP